MQLFWRIWAAVTLVNLAVLSLFVGLATLQFDNINSGLLGERLAVLAGRTAAPFESATKIGLPLSAVRNADALLERARQTDDAILAVHVFDGDGRIIQSTDPSAPNTISAAAFAAREAAAGGAWQRETADGFLGGVDILTAGRESVGGILIVYPGGGNDTGVRAMAAELALAAIAVAFAAAAFGAVLMRFGLGRQIRMFEAIETDIADFERQAWRSAATAPAVTRTEETGDLRQRLAAAEDRYRATGQALTNAGEAGGQ